MSLAPKIILYPILSGVMLTASFPPGKLEWMAWFALIPLLKSLNKVSPSNAFRLGIIAGLAHYLTLMYWIMSVLGNYGGLNPIVSFGIFLLLCFYLSLYTGLFSLLCNYLSGPLFPALMTATIWVSIEWMRATFLTGFPWCLLGYSQHRHLILIQISDLFGVYGVSFLIVAVNALLYALFFKEGSQPMKVFFRSETFVVIIFLIFSISYGYYRFAEYGPDQGKKESVKVAIIQGNIDQSLKWNPEYQKETMDIYLRLSRSTYPNKPRLIVWPETSTPFFFQNENEYTVKILRLAAESEAHLFFGSPAYKGDKNAITYYNRIYHISPRGYVQGYYDKVHLVPFGEYVPMKKWLPFVHRLVPAAGDFTPGKEVATLVLPDFTVGPLICYEAIFPEISRAHARKKADFFINLTNDAWFGVSSAPYQHLVMSSFRAIENRRPLIRAANTGFSAIINKRGEFIRKGDLFCEEVLTGEIEKNSTSRTFYSVYGDILVYLLILMCLINIFCALCYHRLKAQWIHHKGE